MKLLNARELNKIRTRYPAGTIIKLVQMDDCQAPPVGMKGIVKGVDDIGSIMPCWANGSSLHVLNGTDIVEKAKINYCVLGGRPNPTETKIIKDKGLFVYDMRDTGSVNYRIQKTVVCNNIGSIVTDFPLEMLPEWDEHFGLCDEELLQYALENVELCS